MKEILEESFEVQEHFELDANQQQLIDEGVNQLGIEDIFLRGDEYKEQIVETFDKMVRLFKPDLKTAVHLSKMKSYNPSWDTLINKYLESPYLEALTDREQIESIADYMVDIDEIRFDNWKELSLEKMVDVLNQLEQRIARIEHRPATIISTEMLDSKLFGYQLNDRIVINTEYLDSSKANPYVLDVVLETLIHEGRHRYQQYNVDERMVHESLSEVETWRQNMHELGYADGSPVSIIEIGPIGLFTNERLCKIGERLYYYQPIEIDARNFAGDVMKSYRQKMEG